MTEHVTTSTSNSALQALVREQADEINRLREQLDLSGTMSPRAKLLNDVQQDEEKIRNSLEVQLGQARQAKAALEASMEERAKTFQKSLEKLHSSSSTASDVTADSTTPITTEAATNASNDPEVLRVGLRNALNRIAEQETQLKKLKFDLEMEQGHVNILRHDNQMLRQMTVDMTALAEQEEEYISNKLLKRISGLKKEKGELLLQVEQEEEYLTNTLQKKLSQLQKEKIDMENALEQEQEYIVNRLQKQLDQLRVQQSGGQVATGGLGLSRSNSMSSGREGEQGTGANNGAGVPASPVIGSGTHKKWVPSHSPSSSDFGITSQGVVEVLRAEVNALKNRMTEMEKEYLNKVNQTNKLKAELAEYRKRAGVSIEDLTVEESIPSFMRSVPSSPGGRTIRNRDSRSASVSSQRSITSISDKSPQPGPSNSSAVNLGIHIPGSSGSQHPPSQSMPIPSPSRSSGHTSDNLPGSASNSYGGTGYVYGSYGNNPSASVSSSSTASVTSVSSLSGVGGGTPQPAQSRSRSVSNSGNVSSSNPRRDMPTRRISGGPFNVPFQPPQHPPHP